MGRRGGEASKTNGAVLGTVLRGEELHREYLVKEWGAAEPPSKMVLWRLS